MDAETFRAIHRYGAGLSIAAIVLALIAYAIGGPLRPLVFPLGLFGPLSGFYFIGGVLEEHPTYHVLGEELLRGVVWYGGSLLGWAFILSESTVLPSTPGTVLGLPTVTALGLVLMMVAIRRTSGLDLKVQTEGGQLLILITGAIVGGFLVLYLVLVDRWSPMLVVTYVLAIIGGLVVWRWIWRKRGRH